MNDGKGKSAFSVGLARGITGQIIGTVVGIVLVMAVRLMAGLPVWSDEPVWVGGALVGAIGFIIGTGVLRDWYKWTRGKETPSHPQDDYEGGWRRYLSVSFDHKVIGIQYGVTSLLIFAIAG
ncbi:MAG: cytochrome C oxidase subunit I, partial [Chloroflexi bacterium]